MKRRVLGVLALVLASSGCRTYDINGVTHWRIATNHNGGIVAGEPMSVCVSAYTVQRIDPAAEAGEIIVVDQPVTCQTLWTEVIWTEGWAKIVECWRPEIDC